MLQTLSSKAEVEKAAEKLVGESVRLGEADPEFEDIGELKMQSARASKKLLVHRARPRLVRALKSRYLPLAVFAPFSCSHIRLLSSFLLFDILPHLSHSLREVPLTADDVDDVIHALGHSEASLKLLRRAAEETNDALKDLMKEEPYVRARKVFEVACLREKLKPHLGRAGLTWEDVKPMLMTIDQANEPTKASLEELFEDPLRFLAALRVSAGEAAKKMQIAKLRPKVELAVEKLGLVWSDMVPVLDFLDLPVLLLANTDIRIFMKVLMDAEGIASMTMLRAQVTLTRQRT